MCKHVKNAFVRIRCACTLDHSSTSTVNQDWNLVIYYLLFYVLVFRDRRINKQCTSFVLGLLFIHCKVLGDQNFKQWASFIMLTLTRHQQAQLLEEIRKYLIRQIIHHSTKFISS